MHDLHLVMIDWLKNRTPPWLWYISTLLGILSAVFGVYTGYDALTFQESEFTIDFSPDNTIPIGGKDYSSIEVVNDYKTIKITDAYLVLSCNNFFEGGYKSETYELEGYRNLLGTGNSKLFLSQDEVLVNLGQNYNFPCADANVHVAHYETQNSSHLRIVTLHKAEFFSLSGTEVSMHINPLPIDKVDDEPIRVSSCLRCNVSLTILGDGFAQTRNKSYTFSSKPNPLYFDSLLPINESTGSSFTGYAVYVSPAFHATHCSNVDGSECRLLLCNLVMDELGGGSNCQSSAAETATQQSQFFQENVFNVTATLMDIVIS